LDRLSKQYNGQVKIFKVNVDNVPEVAQQFQVEVLPTIFGIVKGNQLVVQDTGLKEEGFVSVLTSSCCVVFCVLFIELNT